MPFPGVYSGDRMKSAERFREEIRIAGLAGNGTIMFAFSQPFKENPELVKTAAEESDGGGNGKKEDK